MTASSLYLGENYEQAASRVAREKLGVGLVLGKVLGEGKQLRNLYVLVMRLYEGTLQRGAPHLPNPPKNPAMTYYTNFEWATPMLFRDGAKLGSLCSRIFLDTLAQ